MYEEMAKQSRKRLNLFGRQRGILAHENKGRNMFGPKSSLQDAGNSAMTSLFPREEANITSARVGKPSSTASKRERHSSTTLQQPLKKLTLEPTSDYVCSGRGQVKTKSRYQTEKKPQHERARSLVDVQI